jgi:hypothetical protein
MLRLVRSGLYESTSSGRRYEELAVEYDGEMITRWLVGIDDGDIALFITEAPCRPPRRRDDIPALTDDRSPPSQHAVMSSHEIPRVCSAIAAGNQGRCRGQEQSEVVAAATEGR